jgi:cytochrome P450
MTVDTIADLPYLDLEGAEFLESPYEVLQQAREQAWAARTAAGIMVLSFEAINDLYSDPRLRQPGTITFEMQGITSGPMFEFWRDTLLHQEGKNHTRLRRLVSGAFSAKAINGYREQMRRQVIDLASSLPVDTPFDFADLYADVLPIGVICSILGVPEQDITLFRGWIHEIGKVGPVGLADIISTMDEAVLGLYGYVEQMVEKRRHDLGDDLLSRLLRAHEGEDRLSLDEIKALVAVIFVGGHDTTRFELGHLMETFLDRPQMWSQLREDPNLARHATEEVLRFRPAIIENFRYAPVDVEYRGTVIPAGTYIQISTASGNHDERCAVNGEEFVLDREPAPHVSFGKGAHFCLGAALTRTEIEETLRVLPQIMHEIRPEGPITRHIPRAITGPDSIPMSFTSV